MENNSVIYKYAVDAPCFVTKEELVGKGSFSDINGFVKGVVFDRFVNIDGDIRYYVAFFDVNGMCITCTLSEDKLIAWQRVVANQFKKGDTLVKSRHGFAVFVFHKWICKDGLPVRFVVIDNNGGKLTREFHEWVDFKTYPVTPLTALEIILTFRKLNVDAKGWVASKPWNNSTYILYKETGSSGRLKFKYKSLAIAWRDFTYTIGASLGK